MWETARKRYHVSIAWEVWLRCEPKGVTFEVVKRGEPPPAWADDEDLVQDICAASYHDAYKHGRYLSWKYWQSVYGEEE